MSCHGGHRRSKTLLYGKEAGTKSAVCGQSKAVHSTWAAVLVLNALEGKKKQGRFIAGGAETVALNYYHLHSYLMCNVPFNRGALRG